MKIALFNLTTTTKSGGVETFNWEMAKALAKRGHTVHLYGGESGFAYEKPRGPEVFTYRFIARERFPNFGTRFRRFMERLSFGFFSLKDLVSRDYDYLYLIKPYDIPLALLVSARSKARVIFGSSGTEFFPGYRLSVRKVDHFFSCSEFNASQIENYCGIRPTVIPNGVDTALFRPLSPDEELRRTLKIAPQEKAVMTVGRLVGLKGVKYGVMAVGKLIRKGYDLKYFVIGDGEERAALQGLVGSMGLEGHVFFLGNIPNAALPRYYSLASAALFPSLAEEAFGISIAEAMACGVPSVATARGAVPEVVGDAGLLVPAEDVDALADGVERILTDDRLRQDLGALGRRRVEENFSWETVVRTFEAHIFREKG